MNKKIPRVVLCFLIGIIAVATFQLAATPNAGPPSFPTSGSLVGEAMGKFRQLQILRENLILDLRVLDDESYWGPPMTIYEAENSYELIAENPDELMEDYQSYRKLPEITATYEVENPGEPVEVELLFVAPGSEKADVSLNGAIVPFELVSGSELNRYFNVPEEAEVSPAPTDNPPVALPLEWQVPLTTPSIDSANPEDALPYQVDSNYERCLHFTVTFPKGISQLQVSYEMIAGTHTWGYGIPDYQVAYILAPARSWGGFGELRVEVLLPENWFVKTSLPMQRAGDTLTANFNGIPDDYLAITTRPDPQIWIAQLLSRTVAILGIGLSWYLVWMLAKVKYYLNHESSDGNRNFILRFLSGKNVIQAISVVLGYVIFSAAIVAGWVCYDWAFDYFVDAKYLPYLRYGHSGLLLLIPGIYLGTIVQCILVVLILKTSYFLQESKPHPLKKIAGKLNRFFKRS
jgi:hypothetical protein